MLLQLQAITSFKVATNENNFSLLLYKIMCNKQKNGMREIKLNRAENRESTEMSETRATCVRRGRAV